MAVTPDSTRIAGLRRVRGEMQVGKECLPLAKAGPLRRQRLLDLHDQFGAGEDLLRRVDDPGAGGGVVAVVQPDGARRVAFDQHLVPVMDEFAHAEGHEADAGTPVPSFPSGRRSTFGQPPNSGTTRSANSMRRMARSSRYPSDAGSGRSDANRPRKKTRGSRSASSAASTRPMKMVWSPESWESTTSHSSQPIASARMGAPAAPGSKAMPANFAFERGGEAPAYLARGFRLVEHVDGEQARVAQAGVGGAASRQTDQHERRLQADAGDGVRRAAVGFAVHQGGDRGNAGRKGAGDPAQGGGRHRFQVAHVRPGARHRATQRGRFRGV